MILIDDRYMVSRVERREKKMRLPELSAAQILGDKKVAFDLNFNILMGAHGRKTSLR